MASATDDGAKKGPPTPPEMKSPFQNPDSVREVPFNSGTPEKRGFGQDDFGRLPLDRPPARLRF